MKYVAILVFTAIISSCGGTFALDPVTYKITYKTPVLIQPWK